MKRSPPPMTAFSKKVIALIRKIPRGKVASYGQIAALAGKDHAARGVGWLLHSCAKSHRLPWQRVINSHGRISFPRDSREFLLQRKFLMKEKVEVSDLGSVSLKIYGWKKSK